MSSIDELWNRWYKYADREDLEELVKELKSKAGRLHTTRRLDPYGVLHTVPYIIVYRGSDRPDMSEWSSAGYSSWTLDWETAAKYGGWFSDDNLGGGYVLSRWVTPNDILGYDKREHEVIVKNGRPRHAVKAELFWKKDPKGNAKFRDPLEIRKLLAYLDS